MPKNSDRVLIITTATSQHVLVPRAAFDDDSDWQQVLDWLGTCRQTDANVKPQNPTCSLAKKKEDIGADAILVKGADERRRMRCSCSRDS